MSEGAQPLSVLFFGTPDFSVVTLQALLDAPNIHVAAVVTQPDRPAGRGAKLRPSPVKICASEHGIPVLQPERIKKGLDSFLEEVSQYGPYDIGVVIAFGQILPVAVLNLPKTGCINIHASLLPRWRGAAPIQRAIMEGDSETGVCLMQMEAGLDTGPVFIEARTEIDAAETAASLHDKLAAQGAELLAANIHDIASGALTAAAQPEEGVTYAEKILKEEAKIDWTQPAQALDRKIRGLSPFPGAFTTLAGKRLKVLLAQPKDSFHSQQQGKPGSIAYVDRDRLEVWCKDGVLDLAEVQLEGKKRMPIGLLLKGTPVPEDTVLGEYP